MATVRVGDKKESYSTTQTNWVAAGTTGLSRTGPQKPLFDVLSAAKGSGWVASTGDGSTTFDVPADTPSDSDAVILIANFNG